MATPAPTQKSHVKPAIKMSSTLALNSRVNEMLASGQSVYYLGFGESRFPVHPKILEAFRKHATVRSYLPVIGLRELRENVAAYYRRKFGIAAHADRVLVGAGSNSLIFAALYALEGDLLLPQPSWVSYETQAQLAGKSVTWMPTHIKQTWPQLPISK